MKKIRFTLFAIAVFSLVFLSSCVALIEELTVLEDGSGTLRFSVGIPTEDYAAFIEAIPDGYRLQDLFEPFSRDEHVTEIRFDQVVEGDRTWDSVELTIADFSAVFGQARRLGPMQVEFLEQADGFRFTQIIDVANSPLVIPGVNLMDLSDATFLVRLNTPQITSTNGIQPGAGVSTWSIPLDEVLQGGATVFMRSNYVLEPYEGFFIPWDVFFSYTVIGFLALGVVSVFVVIIINTVFKREKEPTLRF